MTSAWSAPDLAGRICLVTGASRGAGRAIAATLGECGATVYVTGRSTRAGTTTEGLAGTVEDAAEEVAARGGVGIPARCDHTDDGDVTRLVDRIRDERGRLDVLVNNAWGGYEQHPGAGAFTRPLWEQPLGLWERMFVAGVRAHLVMARAAAPLLVAPSTDATPRLIASTVAWAFGAYLGNAFYDVAKAACVRLAFALGEELRPHGVASVAVAPGFMRTERVLAAHAAEPFDLSTTESPEYVARAIASLAGDPDVMRDTGSVLTAGELARRYGFADVDGSQPEPFRLGTA